MIFQDESTTTIAVDSTTKSRALTQSLLSLDLGYSVLNEELMRRSIGVDVDRLDVLPDDDGNDMALDIEGEEFFETLPQPQHLGRRKHGQNVSSQLTISDQKSRVTHLPIVLGWFDLEFDVPPIFSALSGRIGQD